MDALIYLRDFLLKPKINCIEFIGIFIVINKIDINNDWTFVLWFFLIIFISMVLKKTTGLKID